MVLAGFPFMGTDVQGTILQSVRSTHNCPPTLPINFSSCTLPRSLPADFSRIAVVIPVSSNCHERSAERTAFPLREQESW
jgi:hypothetical protein